jgi:hypothetical protein
MKNKKETNIPKPNKQAPVHEARTANTVPDTLRTNLAIGTLTLFIAIVVLYFINNLIYTSFHPDLKAIVDKVVPLSLWPIDNFYPEPVERLQFQVTILTFPLIIFATYWIINKKRDIFVNSPAIASAVNWAGIVAFIIYSSNIIKQNLIYVPNATNAEFFQNNLIYLFNPLVILIFYIAFAYLFIRFLYPDNNKLVATITNVAAYILAAVAIFDIVEYNIFHLSMQEWGRYMETNAVFYSVTQVYAGKSLLVNLNSQYGLFAWMLGPLFKIIGLTVSTFTTTMAFLNGLSFLFIFIALKRLVKNNIIVIMGFLSLVIWQYWAPRLPMEATARYYYQYMPVRFFFPALGIMLISLFYAGSAKTKKILLPCIAITSSLAIFWNMDSGLPVFGASLIALAMPALGADTIGQGLNKMIKPVAFMFAGLIFIIALFFMTTKIGSGNWPDIAGFSKFQGIFYISGYFMLPMTFVHFWNFPALVYLIACVYVVYNLRRSDNSDGPVITFLFVLGAGLFAYFQGRSYDYGIEGPMYPSIILICIFCGKLADYSFRDQPFKLHERLIFFLIPFLFLADGAFSMLYHTPELHAFASNNASNIDPKKQEALDADMNFIKSNIPGKDTVLFLAKDYESYYYAAGHYYNPLDLASSTEMFFRSELDTLLQLIQTTRHPIVFDAQHPWQTVAIAVDVQDSIIKSLAQHTKLDKVNKNGTLLILKHSDNELPHSMPTDANTLAYKNYDFFNKYTRIGQFKTLPDNFSIEFNVDIDPALLIKGNLFMTNMSQSEKFAGFLMVQNGPDPSQYVFVIGNGQNWSQGVVIKFDPGKENHVVIQVQKSVISAYNNGTLCGQTDTHVRMKHSTDPFILGTTLPGIVHEIKVESM